MYHKQGTDLVNVDKELVRKQGTRVIQRDFSKIVDGKIRHDSDAISLAIMQIVLSDIRYSLKDKKVMTLALEAVLRKHKKTQNIKDKKLKKAEKNARKKNEKIVKKLRKEGKTEKEIEDIVFKEITTKEELLSNIEKKEKEKKKGKGDSYTSKFIEKYNDRISAIKNLDPKESEEEKKLFENFFKKTRKIDNTGKIKAQEQIKTRNSNRGNIKNSSSLNDVKRENEEETKFNTISIHALLDRKTKMETEPVKTISSKEEQESILKHKEKEEIQKEVERLENKIVEKDANILRNLNNIVQNNSNNIYEKDTLKKESLKDSKKEGVKTSFNFKEMIEEKDVNIDDYFKKNNDVDTELEKKRSLEKLRQEFNNESKAEEIENAPSLKDLVKNITSGIDSDKSSTIFKDKLYNDDTKIEERNFDISVGNVEGNTRRQESVLSRDTKVSQRTMEFNISELENKIVESVEDIYKDTDDSTIGFKEKFEIEEVEVEQPKVKKKTRRQKQKQKEKEKAEQLMSEVSKLENLRENKRRGK